MTPEMEQKVLQSLYDRLFDAITYVPGGGKTGNFDRSTTFIQFSKNESLDPKDYTNAASPMNPQGDLRAASAFSDLVNGVPDVAAEYNRSAKLIAETYRTVVTEANTANQVDPKQKATYDAAYKYLNQVTEIKNFDGSITRQTGPTSIAQTYDDNQSAYVTAVSGYRAAQNGYNMDDSKDQRAWQAVAPGLQLNIDKAWNQWVRGGKQNVEQAQQAMATTINNAISAAITQAQDAVRPEHWMKSLISGGNDWMLSYAQPGNWASDTTAGTELSLKSSYLIISSDSSFTSYGGGGSWGAGLWSVGGSFAHSQGSTSYRMDANNLELSAKIKTVRILRPWLNAMLFVMKDWWMTGVIKDGISNGQLKGNENTLLPLIPTGLVVVSDLTIKADFSSEDKTHIESATSGSARVGWGPFSIGGSYSHSESHDKMTATFDGGALRVSGLQILAWISTITPASPPLAAPQSRAARK